MSVLDTRLALEAVCEAGASHLKAEFEAEGASSAEASLLASLASEANLSLIIKIGGCEAVRDIREALQLGAQCIVAPMIESPFAALKFVRAVFEELSNTASVRPELAINIESAAGIGALPAIIEVAVAERIDRVVLGRTDLTNSLGLPASHAEELTVQEIARQVFNVAQMSNIRTTLGGSVTVRSAPFIRSLTGLLDRIETRKVAYPLEGLKDLPGAIEAAVRFEVAWLDLKSETIAPLTRAEARRRYALSERLSIA